jgi:hypothetical protein
MENAFLTNDFSKGVDYLIKNKDLLLKFKKNIKKINVKNWEDKITYDFFLEKTEYKYNDLIKFYQEIITNNFNTFLIESKEDDQINEFLSSLTTYKIKNDPIKLKEKLTDYLREYEKIKNELSYYFIENYVNYMFESNSYLNFIKDHFDKILQFIELKQILKPLIREVVKDVLLEEKGILSHIIQECSEGIKKELLIEIKGNTYTKQESMIFNNRQERILDKKQTLQENKKKIIDSFTKSGNNNLRGIFEGIEPLTSEGKVGDDNKPKSPLSNMDPSDPGIDLNIFNFKGIR